MGQVGSTLENLGLRYPEPLVGPTLNASVSAVATNSTTSPNFFDPSHSPSGDTKVNICHQGVPANEAENQQQRVETSKPHNSDRKYVKWKGKRRKSCCSKKKAAKLQGIGGVPGRDANNATVTSSMDDASGSDEEEQQGGDGNCFAFGGAAEEISLSAEKSVSKMLLTKVRSQTQKRRTRIKNKPDVSLSLWSIIKNAIGKDLTKLPLPVNFNEPLSMLQRLTEDFEYSALIDHAATLTDPILQMAYVAAFTVSSYGNTAVRTGKPFNPLLGETFECDRSTDFGWRCINEQVSHHPPLAAQHCEGRGWVCWQQFSMSSKFKGNSIEITPLGISHLKFTESGNHYTWRKVNTIVHNIMIGRLYVDQEGEMDIFNHSTGDVCHLKYTNSTFRGYSKRVDGFIQDSSKTQRLSLSGYWDQKVEYSTLENGKVVGPSTVIWTRDLPAPDSVNYYNFTVFACQLNEFEEGVAPTDSRRRPDQRMMENGFFDEANAEKLRLEEKQRSTRKSRSTVTKASGSGASSIAHDMDLRNIEPGYSPTWFTVQTDEITGKQIFFYNGNYWSSKESQSWSSCPDIYN